MKISVQIIFLCLLSTTAKAVCRHLDDLPIRQMGRIKPLVVHARQSLKFLTGKKGGKSATAVYCQLSLTPFDNTHSGQDNLLAPIQHLELRQLLKLPDGQKTLPYSQLISRKVELHSALATDPEGLSAFSKAVKKLLNRIDLYEDIKRGTNWFLYHGGQWVPLSQILQKGKTEGLTQLFETSKTNYLKDHGKHHLIELFYTQSRIHFLSMILILISLLLMVVVKNPLVGLSAAGFSALVQVFAVILRILISGRAPITNMYETVLLSGLGALIISLVFGHLRKEKSYVIAGLSYNFLCSLMINFSHSMLSGDISPLVPVLRDNFWLSTHVTTVILSYATLAISWILANKVLIQRRLVGMDDKEFRYHSDLIYTCLKVGTTLLALGIILGGVWADYSWGRFWGWDPKETWSAVALCFYLAILHGRMTKWIGHNQFIPAVAAAFMSVMMAWFGVNYILASGLHSYGFSQGGVVFLGSIFAIQTLILVGTLTTRRKRD